MGYIRDLYGGRSEDFIKGFIAAIETYGIWKDGQQWIGSPEIPIKDAIKEAKKELGWREGE